MFQQDSRVLYTGELTDEMKNFCCVPAFLAINKIWRESFYIFYQVLIV